MGIDVMIDYSCPIKQKLGSEEITRLSKAKNQANVVLEIVRKNGDQRSPAEITFVSQLTTPDGVREVTRNLQEIFDDCAVLEQHAAACGGCPANCLNHPYGCWSYINF